MKILLAAMLALGTTGAIAQQEPAVAPVKTQEMRPGYGVVESITEVRVVSRERSAAAGGSAPSRQEAKRDGKPMYRVTVRLPDGTRQQRDLDKPEFQVGDNVLLTNAGDILPD
jgi:hypothetical protein